MSVDKARYSLRSKCHNTACDCRRNHNLPCRARRNGRFGSFNTSASEASLAPSEFSDVGSEEFDDSFSSLFSPTRTRTVKIKSDTDFEPHGVCRQLFSENKRNEGSEICMNNNSFSNSVSTLVLTSTVINQSKIVSSNDMRRANTHIDNELEYSKRNGHNTLSDRREVGERSGGVKRFFSWVLRLRFLALPIYWLQVLLLVAEKWVLHKQERPNEQNNDTFEESRLFEDSFTTYRRGRSVNTKTTTSRQLLNQINQTATTGTVESSSYNNVMYQRGGREGSATRSLAGSSVKGSVAGSVRESLAGSTTPSYVNYKYNNHQNNGYTKRTTTPTPPRYPYPPSASVAANGGCNSSGGLGRLATMESYKNTAMDGGKRMVSRAMDLFSSASSRGKSTVLMWPKYGARAEEKTEEEEMRRTNTRLRSHKRQEEESRSTVGYVLGDGSSAKGSISSKEGFKVLRNGRNGKGGYEWRGYAESDEEEDNEEIEDGESVGICGNILRILVVLAILLFLLALMYYLWPLAAAFGNWTWAFVTSCLSALVNGITGAFTLLVSYLPTLSSNIKENIGIIDRPMVPSHQHSNFDVKESVSSAPYSSNTPVVHVEPAVSKEDYNAILDKLKSIESTLESHQDQLTQHTFNYNLLRQQIVTLDAATRDVTAKGKSSDEIFYEIMNFRIGVTSNGIPVTLKSLLTIMNQQEQDDDANAKAEGKIQRMAERFTSNIQTLEEKFVVVDGELQKLKEESKNVVIETRTVPVEVDFDKLKATIMPDLMTEMEQRVKISCLTRDCPEMEPGAVMNGPSTADVEKLIDMAIARYDADKTGLPDLALESAGGSILSTRCTKSSKLRNSVVSLWGFRIWSPPNNPRTIIQPGVVPGECWAFEGSVGDVVIRLVGPSIVTGFTLEHIPKAISPYGNIDSAPYTFQVLGLHEEDDIDSAHDYGTFSYEDNGQSLQYFAATNVTTTPYPIVELKILSNHGNLLHTCLYRFRVHGSLAIGGTPFTATVQTSDEA